MKKLSTVFIVLSILLFFMIFNFTSCVKTPSSKYVASTSWVASFAQMAGIENVETIAPANLRHPPEYEITADDILKVIDCEIFMYAGYERMMKTIANASEINEDKILKVKTTNTVHNISEMVNMLSQKAGTQKTAQKNLDEYIKYIEETRAQIKVLGIDKKSFYVNVNQAEFAADLGINIAGTFGPSPLTSAQLEEIALNKYDYIIDNFHNPVTEPAKEVSAESKIIVWRNFPDKMEDKALFNLIKNNCEMLFK